MMDCIQSLKRLTAYRDEELEASDLLSVADHLETCADCQRAYAALENLSALVKAKAPYHDAPAHLAARIAAALPQTPTPVATTKRSTNRWNWLSGGAVFASLLAAAWSVSLYLAQPAPHQQVAEAVLASHVRSLQVSHLSDVASSDQHTVKPWFNGKLDFSPTVIDYTSVGFPLVGGRLDYFDQRAVAALVYRHRLHTINLFIWPGDAVDGTPRLLTLNGYHLVSWSERGMNYWAVSDLASNELERFARIVRHDG